VGYNELVEKVLGGSEAAICHHERGGSKIAVTDLVKIADYYLVPMCHFLGK
jgi:hypothetical protein